MIGGISNVKFTKTDISNVVHNLRSDKIDIDDDRVASSLLNNLNKQSLT